MLETFGFPILVAVVVIFLGWFFVGTQWNVRKGDAILKWLNQGLSLVGEKSTMRWLGSSVMELKIAKAKDPFRTAETLALFEPRDVFFTWGVSHWQGRRDTIIFRAQLRSAPTFDLEVFDPQGWTTRTSESALRQKNWTRTDLTAGQPLVAYSSGAWKGDPHVLVDIAARGGGRLLRLAVRRNVPNLEVHWILPDLQSHPARELFTTLRKIGEQVLAA